MAIFNNAFDMLPNNNGDDKDEDNKRRNCGKMIMKTLRGPHTLAFTKCSKDGADLQKLDLQSGLRHTETIYWLEKSAVTSKTLHKGALLMRKIA